MQPAFSMLTADLRFSPPVIAHRGARARAPENTLAAFALAKKEGATWIETDVKLTHDGVPILMHDDTVNRTTDGKGPVAELSWEKIQSLDAGSWFNPGFCHERVPSLGAALHFALEHKMRINLEIKPCPGRTQATTMVTIIETAKIWPEHTSPPLISSFDIEALTIAAGLHPEWPRGLLLDTWRDDWRALVQKVGASTIHLDAKLLTRDRLTELGSAQIPLLAYTVNNPTRATELLRSGVHAVFSDTPKEIIQAL